MTQPSRARPQLPCWRAKANHIPRWATATMPALAFLLVLALLPSSFAPAPSSTGPIPGAPSHNPETGAAPSVSISPPPHLIVELLSGDTTAVNNLLTNVVPLLEAGDTVDLYDYSSGCRCVGVSPPRLDTVATQLLAALPSGVSLDVNTGLIPNVKIVANGISNQFSSVAATYEPVKGATGESSYSFTAALAYFSQVNQIDHAAGFASVAYPTGGPLLDPGLKSYAWNYGEIAQVTDKVWVETQQYSVDAVTDPSVWVSALSTLIAQFNGTGEPLSKLAVQITLGNNGHGTGTDPATALVAIRTAVAMGIQNVYLWTAPGYESDLTTFLHSFSRSPPPPTRYLVSGAVDSSAHSAIAGAEVFANSTGNSSVAVTNQTGGFTFLLQNGTYQLSAFAFGYDPSYEANVTVAGGPVAGLALTLAPSTYPVSGVVHSSNGSGLAAVTVFANSSVGSSVTVTNPMGGFTFYLPNGTYRLSAVALRYGPSPEANITVAGAPVAGLALALPTLVFTVRGTVTNVTSGRPIANATVAVVLSNSSLRETTSTTGQFELSLEAGQYSIYVSAFPYESVNRTFTVGPGNLSVSFPLVPSPTFLVNGTIAVSNGSGAVSNATLRLSTPNGTLGLAVKNGSFTLHVPNGTYQLEVSVSGFAPVILEVNVSGNQTGPIHVLFSALVPALARGGAEDAFVLFLQIWEGAAEATAAAGVLLFALIPRHRRPPGTAAAGPSVNG